MRLTMKQLQAVTPVTAQRYRNTSKKIKQQIRMSFVRHGLPPWLCALWLVQSRTPGMAGRKRVIVGDVRQRPAAAEAQVL